MANYYNEMYNLLKPQQRAPVSQFNTKSGVDDSQTRLGQLQALQRFENQQKLYDPAFWSQAFGGLSSGYPISSAPASTPMAPSPYEAKMNALMTDPNALANSASYRFRLDQGNQAIQRSAAAKGMLGSGNTLAELLRYGQGEASQEYGKEMERLATLRGQDISRDTTLRGQDLNLQAMREKAALDAKNNFAAMMAQQMFNQLNKPSY